MRRALAVLAVLAALAALALVVPLAALPARAQNAALSGTFVLDRSASENVGAAIDRAAGRVTAILRPLARRRLRGTNAPYERIAIAQPGSEITIATNGDAPVRTPASGTPVAWRRPADGDRLQVSTAWSGATLRQTFRADDGQRVNTYTLAPDGRTLTLDVAVSSPRLPGGLGYRLVYTKQ